MQLSGVFLQLGEERLPLLLRGVSIGKLKTYQLYERFKTRTHLPKVNTESLRKAAPRFWSRLNEQDEEFAEQFHRDRRVHGGEIDRLDDDQLARLTEEERVAAGLDDYDPDEVPPATDTPPLTDDITQTEVYQEERAEVQREYEKGELYPIDEEHPFPPTRYE